MLISILIDLFLTVPILLLIDLRAERIKREEAEQQVRFWRRRIADCRQEVIEAEARARRRQKRNEGH